MIKVYLGLYLVTRISEPHKVTIWTILPILNRISINGSAEDCVDLITILFIFFFSSESSALHTTN